PKALDYYNQAIEKLRQFPRQLSMALRDLGTLYSNSGEHQNAIKTFKEALQVSRGLGDPLGEAEALAGIAKVERDRGRLNEAKSLAENALASVESLRLNLKSQNLRTAFFASARKHHELYINVLMSLHAQNPSAGFDVLALQASENARARSLLELLNESNAQIRKDVDSTLAERQRNVRQAISVKAEQQMRLLSGKYNAEDAKRVSRELDALANEYEEIQTKIRQTSPRYAALTQPVPLTLKEIQSQLLDENTILLEYNLGEDKSFLWAVGQGSLKSFELPKRSEIEAAARPVYELLTAPNRSDNYPPAIAALSRMLLGPAASELKNKRLLIVAEGVLQYVPFAALAEPDEAGAPLMVKHEIVTLPSASVLGVLRQETKERVPAPKSIAVFADPVFESNDARFAAKTPETNLSEGLEVTRSANESGLMNFPRLRFSREEAKQILKFASRNQSLAAVDFAANRDAATSTDLQDYRIVHFATHGIINSRHAELSGIVLSLVDQKGKPQNGFLRLYDVYNMNLKADLVVLSACQTALGRDIKGEGLIGLTRAFMYGGATRVVASLWQADDRGTAVFMSRFYEGLLSKGMSAPAALRNAQVSMYQDKRWQNPRYWAAFTIQGEWK
ncbi:MAG TPA: CHAT domain-containing tetratricopeptide repeat protein, partial [Pyrinomonadaceae bacterium]|nr:CHAT domain-containing tetratricopeptide repeat protein [Pyrinomonadaceae bacterium]